jgi:gamma-glutamylcyclotransferase
MAADPSLLYLAYGSNLHPRRLRERIGDVELAGVVELPGWRLCFDKRGDDGSAKANLRPVPGSNHVAWAAAYRVQPEQWPALDRFEGCGGGYETFRFDVCLGDAVMPALAYLTPSHWTTESMRPFDWYRELIVAGARFLDLPKEYVDMVSACPVTADPDQERRLARLALAEQCRLDSSGLKAFRSGMNIDHD